MEDIGNCTDSSLQKYYTNRNRKGFGSSFEAKLLLPLKTLGYGIPSHCLRDYFQMSPALAREACFRFDATISTLYAAEYLRKPTPTDLKNMVKLHRSRHKVDGMIGSIDCCHTHWKNCPTAWQGAYTGKERKPTIVMEAICDYHLWFWNISYGYAGTLNDLNILSLSPFLDSLLDGTFEKLEEEAGVVPFTIGSYQFNKCFVLVDGIYPRYARFIRGISEPWGEKEKRFTQWQEGARKDIERAFGVLQSKFQFVARPIHLFKVDDISKRIGTCIILHNMCVSDRVMGDVRPVYNPAASIEEEDDWNIENPEEIVLVQQQTGDGNTILNSVGIHVAPQYIVDYIARLDRFNNLRDAGDHAKLMHAIVNVIGEQKRKL